MSLLSTIKGNHGHFSQGSAYSFYKSTKLAIKKANPIRFIHILKKEIQRNFFFVFTYLRQDKFKLILALFILFGIDKLILFDILICSLFLENMYLKIQ